MDVLIKIISKIINKKDKWCFSVYYGDTLLIDLHLILFTDYLGGYQYVSALPKFFPISEGYIEVSGSSYKYVYQYKDHLGNIRLSYDKNLVLQDENQYYPFGLLQKRPTDVNGGI